jgi:hypothetical protein
VPTSASVRLPAAPGAAEGASPASGERRAAAANVALRGESLARASEGDGVVIRRRKRA